MNLYIYFRNNPMTMDKYQVDFKGRFLGDVPVGMPSVDSNSDFQVSAV